MTMLQPTKPPSQSWGLFFLTDQQQTYSKLPKPPTTSRKGTCLSPRKLLCAPFQQYPHPESYYYSHFYHQGLISPVLELRINQITQSVLLCLDYFVQHNVCEITHAITYNSKFDFSYCCIVFLWGEKYIYFYSLQLMSIWAVSSLGLLWTKLWTCLQMALNGQTLCSFLLGK